MMVDVIFSLSKLPDELQLALRTIVTLESQELIFILYPEEKLTLEEIKERLTSRGSYRATPSLAENSIRQCIDGLWVTSFYEGGFEDHQHFYELTTFGRRLLKGVLDALYIVEDKGHKADAQRMCTKLRAIEAWFESEVKGYPDLYKKLGGLEKLLGKEAS